MAQARQAGCHPGRRPGRQADTGSQAPPPLCHTPAHTCTPACPAGPGGCGRAADGGAVRAQVPVRLAHQKAHHLPGHRPGALACAILVVESRGCVRRRGCEQAGVCWAAAAAAAMHTLGGAELQWCTRFVRLRVAHKRCLPWYRPMRCCCCYFCCCCRSGLPRWKASAPPRWRQSRGPTGSPPPAKTASPP